MTYNLCKKLCQMGKLTADMLDVYFAAGRLSSEEYTALQNELKESVNEE